MVGRGGDICSFSNFGLLLDTLLDSGPLQQFKLSSSMNVTTFGPHLSAQAHRHSMELGRGSRSGGRCVLQTLLLLLLCCTSVERVRCEEVSFVSHGDDLFGVTAVYIDPYPGTAPQNVWGNCP